MPRFLVAALKFIAIVFTPIAVIGFVISKLVISGDQYAAVLELLGSNSRPGSIEFFGADIQTISQLLDFCGAWSLPALVAFVFLGILGLVFSNDRIKSTWHVCLGLFFSFSIWAIFIAQSGQMFIDSIGSAISDLSALVIAAFLSELSDRLLSLTGLLALSFGVLALGFWYLANRRKARTLKSLN